MKFSHTIALAALILSIFCWSETFCAAAEPINVRKPIDDDDLQYWLRNMVWYHHYSIDEIKSATGLNAEEIRSALKKFDITTKNRPKRKIGKSLLVLPYPGGRHPRIGFLEGAIRPQRETKISVLAPWNETDYFVVDVPEAIWSNLGLTYLAHTHIPTIWSRQNIEMKKLEWKRNADGTLDFTRELPNGIAFGTKIEPQQDSVRMKMWLKNGTKQKLTDLRVQICVMLKGAPGFAAQTNENKFIKSPYVACRSEDSTKWIITAWDPVHRPWANQKCPCLHSDPKFPDANPGETKHLTGWLSFYEGKQIEAEFKRIESTGWRKK